MALIPYGKVNPFVGMQGCKKCLDRFARMDPIRTPLTVLPTTTGMKLPPVTLFLRRLSPNSRKTAVYSLRGLVRHLAPHDGLDETTFPWHRLREEHTRDLVENLTKEYAPASIRRMLIMLRGVLRICVKRGEMTQEEFDGAISFPPVRVTSRRDGKLISDEDMAAMYRGLASTLNKKRRLRDCALLAVLAGCGVRRMEACGIRQSDIGAFEGVPSVRVKGKRARYRTVPMPPKTQEALNAWREKMPSLRLGYVFCHVASNQTIDTSRPLRPRDINRIVARACERGGLTTRYSPHDFRRTLITRLLRENVDLLAVQKLAGHASPTTTGVYDLRVLTEIFDHARGIDLPFEVNDPAGRSS